MEILQHVEAIVRVKMKAAESSRHQQLCTFAVLSSEAEASRVLSTGEKATANTLAGCPAANPCSFQLSTDHSKIQADPNQSCSFS